MVFCAVVGNVCYDPAGARRWPLRGFSKGSIAVWMLSLDFVYPLSANDSDSSVVARGVGRWMIIRLQRGL